MKQTLKKRLGSLIVSLCMVLTMMPAVAFAEGGSICSIGDQNFTSLSAALDAVQDGETIKLLQSVAYDKSIQIQGIHVTFDLNGYNMNVTAPNSDEGQGIIPGLYVTGKQGNPGQVELKGNGAFNVSGGTGVQADDGSTATVTNAKGIVSSMGYQGIGALAAGDGSVVTVLNRAEGERIGARSDGGGTVTVCGDAIGGYCGAYATGERSLIKIKGDAMATGDDIDTSYSYIVMGVYAEDGGEVSVQGNAEASTVKEDISPYGVLANFNGTVTVKGYAKATGRLSSGACAQNGMAAGDPNIDKPGGLVTVWGDAIGMRRGATAVNSGSSLLVKGDAVATGTDGIGARANSQSKVTVEGNATGIQYGVLALNNGEVIINGNVEAAETGAGAVTSDDGSGTVTIDGRITVTDPSKYIAVGAFAAPEYKAITDMSASTTKPDYYTYSSGSNYVWVKIPAIPAVTYLITFNINDGSASPDTSMQTNGDGKLSALPNPNRNNYYFDGWFTERSNGIKVTESTVFDADTTLYAHWTPTNNNNGGNSGGGGGSSAVTAGLTVKDLADGKKSDVAIKSTAGTVTLPSDMLSNLNVAKTAKAEVKMTTVNPSNLTKEVQTILAGRPIVSLSLLIDGKVTEWNNSKAPVTVSIPYVPTAEELQNPSGITAYYIDSKGNLTEMAGAKYDPATKSVVFKTIHFSYYAVGYKAAAAPKVRFSDVLTNAWYYEAVNFCAEKGITSGTSDTTFSPNAELTRGQFLTMLMKAYSIEPVSNPTDNFADAGNTYYTGYLAAAKAKGISNGIGNNSFAPNQAITRQEMFTLLYNALKGLDKLPAADNGKSLADFNDNRKVASWATDAMDLLVKSGTVSGSGGKLDPTGGTTRAQMAQVLHNLVKK